MKSYEDLFLQQKDFFLSGETKRLRFRIDALRRFDDVVSRNEKKIGEAAYQDIKKPFFEVLTNEIASVRHEIRWNIRNLGRWTRARHVPTNLANFPGRSRIYTEPYGSSLVIGTWNYPFLLNLKPAVSAIAAGNTLIIKPSEFAPSSSGIIAEIIRESFIPSHCSVVEGGIPEVTELLSLPFDKIFFTGSTEVGKIVMGAASRFLSNLTLELGGKSPAIILSDANLAVATRRIAWGKFLNAGQSCIAPDFLFVQADSVQTVIELLKGHIRNMFGENPALSDSFGRIIDNRHFDRLVNLIDPDLTVAGGQFDRKSLYISPTILYPAGNELPVMKEEIFGPILPIIPFTHLDEALSLINGKEKPLALYLFTRSKAAVKKMLRDIPFGGGCINDSVIHIANPYLPFGGVGPSGMGKYHGKAGILEFSHLKPVMFKPTWFDPFIRYAPYTKLKERILRKLL